MDYYDSIAEGYEELHSDEQNKKIKIIEKYLKPAKDDKLLDVGCGTGMTTIPWKCICYGIDPAKKLLARAHDKDRITYKLARAEDIPYPDRSFDYVISITAIQNFADIEKGLSEIKRVGRGRYVLSFLKRSAKAAMIRQLICLMFDVQKELEEDKDLIFICGFSAIKNS